jgi:hypothetical protein
MNDLAEISKALLTPLIAIITTFIAFQQWRTNQQKLILDLYDRRMKIYQEVKNILIIIERDATASREELWSFYRSVSEADFLFGSEIRQYIDEIYQRGFKLHTSCKKYRDHTQNIPEGYNHDEIVNTMDEELHWFMGQFEIAKDKFKKYLSLKHY